ncbi:MAG: hypothetical protein LBE12_16670 [Planctomycetaceae bacterium]|nr:hypothetical protein [Planctomycetaceae bacterium]
MPQADYYLNGNNSACGNTINSPLSTNSKHPTTISLKYYRISYSFNFIQL